MVTSRGMDVSAYQGVQDWAALKAKGVVFAFAKASEGQRSRDDRFDTHIGGIIKADLIPGAYHFAWPTQDVAAEAANYIGAVRPYAKAGFVHWLDLEAYSDRRNYGSRTGPQIRAWVSEWLRLVAAAFPGQRLGVYTSADDIARGHLPAGVPLWFPRYPWGAADWVRAEKQPQPLVHGRSVLFWQFTSQPYDRNIAYLSEAALRAWAAGDSTEEDDMQTSDQLAVPAWAKSTWPKDEGLADGKIAVSTALASGYSHARRASENSVALLAQVAALTAVITKLAAGGGLTAAEVQAAAEAGAQAALATLGDKLQED
ncbi:glycoside hydrolase family 25 protein [Streptomyces sp. NPDC005760]|uniref:glycoside hydrolase family 25 protein n=1 Tax=Streptomyces sp. NPDC005760 TaxID=3156718 RepID=UPI0033D4C1F8